MFVLFLGGHGRSFAGEGWFYLPQDFDLAKGHTIEKNAIGPDKLRDWLAKIPAEKSLVVLDACESGAFEAFRGGDRERETVMAQLEYATGRNYITAAPAGKAAYEGYKGHGVLTYAILDALHRPKGAAVDDGSVSVLDVARARQPRGADHHPARIRHPPAAAPDPDRRRLPPRHPYGGAEGCADRHPDRADALHQSAAQGLQGGRRQGRRGAAAQAQRDGAVVKSERGWAQIAREGKALGFVPERQLQKVE